ncbi:hypothetical protein GGI20_003785 [Coemansia sp. BCRC 34301]|nr:hypothetical protein GGI20_003785 [Coemansia sp. BCRC 34301]
MPYTTTWTAIADVAPFPALSTLEVSGGYAFDDDLLFRGNSKTLRRLCIPFCAIARNALGRFKILKRGDVMCMDSICIGDATDADNVFIAEQSVLIKQQMDDILETTRSLTLGDKTNDNLLMNAIYAAPSSAVLQSVRLTYLVFDLCHTIKVVAALPSLVSFTCVVHDASSNIGSISENERPSGLRAAHYPLSQNFRVLRMTYMAESATKVAIVAIKVAAMCPNLVRVDMPPKLRPEFSREIAWATYNDSFEPYTDSLRHLVYRDLNS